MRVLILSGGMGTRLGDASQGLPKPMVPVAGRPCLAHILDRLPEGSAVTLCVGYKKEYIMECFGREYRGMNIEYSAEDTPLGTGGAVLRALRGVSESDVCVINGDTVFDAPIDKLMDEHVKSGADVTLALKPMRDYDRYGTVVTDGCGRIISFTEKQFTERGLINGGIYMLKTRTVLSLGLPEVFSLERDLFEKHVNDINMRGISYDALFIDIGVPEDLTRADTLLI